MCLIITAPKGNQIPLEILEDATQRNSDGWGVMYHDGHRIVTEKSPKPNAQAVYDLTKNNPHETVVHLRMTTHGDNTTDNTHPFEIIPERLYMMHNGIIDVDAPRTGKRSDTRVVVEDFIKPVIGDRPKRLRNSGLKNFIQNLIGTSSNRLVFLDEAGELTYFNKRLGMEWKGLWCSNTYAWSLHAEGKPKVVNTYKTYKDWSGGRDYRFDSWFDHRGPAKDADIYGLDWAPGNVQAAFDEEIDDPNELVMSRWGLELPAWVEETISLQYDDLIQQDTATLAAAIETLHFALEDL